MLNMQFDKPVIVSTAEMEWEASPMAGVWRKPLAREGAEHGHTTSVVRYDADSRFSSHAHPKGEEILVLDGVFSDEHFQDWGIITSTGVAHLSMAMGAQRSTPLRLMTTNRT